ncbi:uncharacterized protein LOC135692654 isoform X2 [Rhopilema esculentum]|uniref:uncharacterized protein LOC135692654 isoform X2 n=1 Tax=Rhopilema esculentum TaxID=499914 RepID=UPI0031D9ED10
MVTYPVKFPNIESRKRRKFRFCSARDATCWDDQCTTCVCNTGLVYYRDLDYCEVPPPTTPPIVTSTSSPSTTTLESSMKARKTEVKSTSTSTWTPEKSFPTVASTDKTTQISTAKPTSPITASIPTTTKQSTSHQPYTTQATRNQASTTAVFKGENKMLTATKKSQAGLIAGLCVGFIVLITCIVLFLYLKKRRQNKKNSSEKNSSSRTLQFQDLNGRNGVDSPVSPVYDYTYDTMGRPVGNGRKNDVGNPLYNTNIPISDPVYKELESGEQPVYKELEGGEQVYMSPGDIELNEQPVYRELDDSQPQTSPVYREIDAGPPVYAQAWDQDPSAPNAVTAPDAGDPRMYQQLNYAATQNTYQPLSYDWKNQKYDR